MHPSLLRTAPVRAYPVRVRPPCSPDPGFAQQDRRPKRGSGEPFVEANLADFADPTRVRIFFSKDVAILSIALLAYLPGCLLDFLVHGCYAESHSGIDSSIARKEEQIAVTPFSPSTTSPSPLLRLLGGCAILTLGGLQPRCMRRWRIPRCPIGQNSFGCL